MKKFYKISGDTRVDGDQYYGPVVASRDGIFILPDRKATMFGGMGGLVGSLIEAGVDKAFSKSRLRTCDLGELPAEVVADPDWPVQKKNGAVVVVPRAAVRSLRLGSWLSSLLKIQTEDKCFQVVIGLFSRKAVRRFLQENDWELQE